MSTKPRQDHWVILAQWLLSGVYQSLATRRHWLLAANSGRSSSHNLTHYNQCLVASMF